MHVGSIYDNTPHKRHTSFFQRTLMIRTKNGTLYLPVLLIYSVILVIIICGFVVYLLMDIEWGILLLAVHRIVLVFTPCCDAALLLVKLHHMRHLRLLGYVNHLHTHSPHIVCLLGIL